MIGSSNKYAKIGQPSYGTQEFIDALSKYVEYKPNKLFIMVGANDIVWGVSNATTIANYATICNAMRANGAKIYHCLATYRSATNISPFNTDATNYANANGDTIIDTYTPSYTNRGTDLDADGIHQTTTGQARIGALVATYL